MKKLIIIICIFTTISISRNKIISGSEKLYKDAYVSFNLPKDKIKSNLKVYIWDVKKGKWDLESSSRFKIQDSVLCWKPSKSTLQKDNCRLRVMEGNKLVYLSPSYFRLNEHSSGKQVFEAEGNSTSLSNFKIFPNPVRNSQINIISENDNVEILSLRIIDLSGLEVYEVSDLKASSIHQINLPNISKGVYIISIKTSESIETEKLIIE